MQLQRDRFPALRGPSGAGVTQGTEKAPSLLISTKIALLAITLNLKG